MNILKVSPGYFPVCPGSLRDYPVLSLVLGVQLSYVINTLK